MSNKSSEASQRDLTTMEYVILGLLSAAPQSGYTLIHTMEMTESRWRVSSGAIYPALKRLEHRGLIAGEIAPSDNIRQRKVYHVTGGGEAQLNTWVSITSVDLNDREIPLIKFLFAEQRMSREQVLQWLDSYEQCMNAYEFTHQAWHKSQFTVS